MTFFPPAFREHRNSLDDWDFEPNGESLEKPLGAVRSLADSNPSPAASSDEASR